MGRRVLFHWAITKPSEAPAMEVGLVNPAVGQCTFEEDLFLRSATERSQPVVDVSCKNTGCHRNVGKIFPDAMMRQGNPTQLG
jgi:hypothetical protein